MLSSLRWLPLAAAVCASASVAATECNTLKLTHCGLPFPNDEFTVADDTSPTGLHIEYPDSIIAADLIARWGARMAPSVVMNGRPGYSAIAPIIFELSADIDPATLPLDGADAVQVFDLTTGARVGINAEQSPLTDSVYITDRKPALQIYPRSRFAFGHKHLAIVTDQLRDLDGAVLAVPEGVPAALADGGDPQYAAVRSFLAEHGIAAGSVRAFTTFTVNDEEFATSPLQKMVERVYQTSHGVRNLHIEYRHSGAIALHVTGQLKTTDFRFAQGDLDWSGNTAHEGWIDFDLYLPAQAKYSSVPLMVYGHGIVAFRQTAEILGVAPGLAERGIATIAIDHPLHGSRGSISTAGTSIFNIQAPEYIPDLIGMASQSPLDFHSLLAATRDVLSHFDPFIYADGSTVLSPPAAGREVLDMDKLFFTGTSMGGVFGTSFITTAPFRASFFQVAGANIGQAFTHTIFFDDLLYFEKMYVGSATDVMFADVLLHHAVDAADGLNLLHLLREPAGDLLERPLFVQYGIRDEVVVPQEPWAAIDTLGLPMVGPQLMPMPFPVVMKDDIGDGWGFSQTNTSLADLSSFDRLGGLGDLATHLTFLETAGLDTYFEWADHLITPLVPFVDSDDDGVAEHIDNCRSVANPGQEDDDNDGEGNACETATPADDSDHDGVANTADNCPWVVNSDQADADADGTGDLCENVVPPVDTDADGVADVADNCSAVSNADQLDTDGDGVGDACDRVVGGGTGEGTTGGPSVDANAGRSSIGGGGGAFGWMLVLLAIPVLRRRR